MDTYHTDWSKEQFQEYIEQTEESGERLAIRVDGKIDQARVYPLTASEIFNLLLLCHQTDNFVTRNEVHLRILQALVPDPADPDPDPIACWINHHIVYGVPSLALAQLLESSLTRSETARLIAEEWFDLRSQEEELWLEEQDEGALDDYAPFTRFIWRNLVCFAISLLLILLAAQFASPWCWLVVATGSVLAAFGLWRCESRRARITNQEEK